jgi:hypothetical protein
MSSGKKDKDEEAMLNDISGGGESNSGDPFDQLDDKPKSTKRAKNKKSNLPQDKVELQTD